MIKFRCRGPRKDDKSMTRVGCGEDLTKLVEAVAVDGKDHGIECPKCGNVSSIRRMPVEDLPKSA